MKKNGIMALVAFILFAYVIARILIMFNKPLTIQEIITLIVCIIIAIIIIAAIKWSRKSK